MCLYFHIVYKKKWGSLCKFLDYMDLSSQTYMKWPLAIVTVRTFAWHGKALGRSKVISPRPHSSVVVYTVELRKSVFGPPQF